MESVVGNFVSHISGGLGPVRHWQEAGENSNLKLYDLSRVSNQGGNFGAYMQDSRIGDAEGWTNRGNVSQGGPPRANQATQPTTHICGGIIIGLVRRAQDLVGRTPVNSRWPYYKGQVSYERPQAHS